MAVKNWMTGDIKVLNEQDSLIDAIRLARDNRIRHIPILKEGKLTGIVTDRDIKRETPHLSSSLSQEEYVKALERITLKKVMTKNPITVSPDTSMGEAVKILYEKKISGLPVVEDGDLAGFISEVDVLRAFHALLNLIANIQKTI